MTGYKAGSITVKQIGFLALVLALSGCGGAGTGGGNTATGPSTSASSAVGSGVEKNAVSVLPSTDSSTSPPASTAPASTPPANTNANAAGAGVQLSGAVTYDRVPFKASGGLDYPATFAAPVRGVRVQLLNGQAETLATTITDAQGHYRFSAPSNTPVKVRVLAQLFSSSPSWQVTVGDNTQNNASYVVEGSLASTGTGAKQSRDLHAGSGWAGGAYTLPRSAAPFAILDSIYDSLQLLVSADPFVNLPNLNVRWSEKNLPASGSLAQGFIGSSMYSAYDATIYVLGKADNDSDEYDRGVIQHEFGHFVENKLSRSESIGGAHNLDSKVDLRVAFGEGWGNAFAGMSANDPVYRDSMGAGQAQAFAFDAEDNTSSSMGWYNERSVQSILWDIFDRADDGDDRVSLGFGALYQALHSQAYRDYDGLTSIYPVMELVKRQNPQHAAQISKLMQGQQIMGSGMYGEGETNDSGYPLMLPVYQTLALGGNTSLCSQNHWQDFNGADARRLVLLHVPADGNYTLSAKVGNNSMPGSDPDFRLWRNGQFVLQSTSASTGEETTTRKLTQGTYTLELYDSSNADDNSATGGLACFALSFN